LYGECGAPLSGLRIPQFGPSCPQRGLDCLSEGVLGPGKAGETHRWAPLHGTHGGDHRIVDSRGRRIFGSWGNRILRSWRSRIFGSWGNRILRSWRPRIFGSWGNRILRSWRPRISLQGPLEPQADDFSGTCPGFSLRSGPRFPVSPGGKGGRFPVPGQFSRRRRKTRSRTSR